MATITISRHFGAGGATLGARIAKRLGYKYINDELVRELAKHIGVSIKEVSSVEKRKPSKLIKFLEKIVRTDIIERRRKHKPIDMKEYIEGVRKVILRLYKEGNSVIIGRGGNYILQNKKDVIHILVVAGKEYRIHFLMETYGLTEEQAKRSIERADLIRSEFLYYFSNRENHDDPLIYTLCLNMDHINMNQAEDLVIELVKQKDREMKE